MDVLYRRPNEARVKLLADRLDDADPGVRVARRFLQDLAGKKEFRDRVTEEGMRMLAGDVKQWRGLEQATILLTQLDYKAAAKRMVELLPTDRPEVAVTAAWGLRKLADPDTRRAVVDYVAEKRRQTLAGKRLFPAEAIPFSTINHQLSQLIQFLGNQRFAAADPVLLQYLPRRGDQGLGTARAAAAWSLGWIHEGEPDAGLTATLLARLDDAASIPPEDPRVRRMAAIALGRTKAAEVLPHLRRYCPDHQPVDDPIHDACGWAIEQLSTDPNDAMLPPNNRRCAATGSSCRTIEPDRRPPKPSQPQGCVMLHVALWEPEIPPNTGNVARLCAATGTVLHLIGRLGFRLDDRSLRRAGLDYWKDVDVRRHDTLAAFEADDAGRRVFCFTAHAETPYTQARYQDGDCLLFGGETFGLPPEVREHYADRSRDASRCRPARCAASTWPRRWGLRCTRRCGR